MRGTCGIVGGAVDPGRKEQGESCCTRISMTVGPLGGFAAFATVMLRPLRLLVTQVILFGDVLVSLQIYPPSQTPYATTRVARWFGIGFLFMIRYDTTAGCREAG